MYRSLFLSSISLAAALANAGCSDDSCGPGSASKPNGLVVGDQDQKLTYGNLVASKNHDCPDPTAPDVEPLTISGSQTDGQGLLTLCIPRPDQLIGGVPLGTGVRIIDLHGTFNGCTYSYESTRPVQGTVVGHGVCNNGTDAAGFSLVFDDHISLSKDCTTTTDTIAVNMNGEVDVSYH
jgi:hypothetical protein